MSGIYRYLHRILSFNIHVPLRLPYTTCARKRYLMIPRGSRLWRFEWAWSGWRGSRGSGCQLQLTPLLLYCAVQTGNAP